MDVSFIDLVKDFGPNGVLLIALMYAARWLAHHVAKPLVESHKSFLEGTMMHMKKVEQWLEAHSESLTKLTEASTIQLRLLERLGGNVRKPK